MNAREIGKRNAAIVTGALVAAAIAGTAAVVLAVQPAEATGTGTSADPSGSSPDGSSTSANGGGLSSDNGDSGSAHGQSGGS